MKKELKPVHEETVCDVCGRTMLKGERAEPYLVGGGQRMLVCELCTDRAYAQGWIRESAHDDLPASQRRPEQRRSLLSRLRRRQPEPSLKVAAAIDGGAPPSDDLVVDSNVADITGHPEEIVPETLVGDGDGIRLKDPRHVRAVPTNAQVKVERAIEVFNGSEHPRTIAGIARTLGEPWVSASPDPTLPSEVSVVVAWELSWYHYRVDLGDEHDPVTLAGKGEELDELADWAKEWNAAADTHGRLALGVRSGQ